MPSTRDYKQVMLQLVVYNAYGPAGGFLDVVWEISVDGKNWVQNPSGGVFFNRVTIAGAPTASNQMILETNVGAWMRVAVRIGHPAPGTHCAFHVSVIAVGRN